MADEPITSGNEGSWGAQLSIKFGNNCMINVRAADVEQLIGEANRLSDSGAFLVGVAEDFQALATIQAAFPQTTQIQAQPSAPPPAGPAQTVPVCAHGAAMEFKSGFKNGKAWSGYFCTVRNDPRLAQCATQWQR